MGITNGRRVYIAVIILILLSTSTLGCLWDSEQDKDEGPVENGTKEPNGDNNTTSPDFEEQVAIINSKALAWVETLNVDPIKLRYEMGIKGKKKFVELLDIYFVLYETASDSENKSKYKSKVEELASVARKFDLKLNPNLSKCTLCGEDLTLVSKEKIKGKIPEKSFKAYNTFWNCKSCGKIYWQGSHWRQIVDTITEASRPSER